MASPRTVRRVRNRNRPSMPPVFIIDTVPVGRASRFLAPLFEGAPRFLGRLAAERPFGTADNLFERAREIALSMPEPEQVELLDAHPRLGAPPGSVSELSFHEQGYDRDPDDVDGAARLERLNDAYEERYGFRYCVFVAGRPLADLIPEFEAALRRDRGSELRRGLGAVIDIAADRYGKISEGEARP